MYLEGQNQTRRLNKENRKGAGVEEDVALKDVALKEKALRKDQGEPGEPEEDVKCDHKSFYRHLYYSIVY